MKYEITILLNISVLLLFISLFFILAILKKNPCHICLPFLVLHLVFYFYPFVDYLGESNLYYSIFNDYQVAPSRIFVAQVFCFLSANFLLMSVLFYLFTPKFTPIEMKTTNIQFRKLKLIFISILLFYILAKGFARANLDLVYYFSPARKDIGFSGMERALLSILPICLAVILFNEPKKLFGFLLFFLIIILIIFVLGQRRQIIMAFSFCILFNYRHYIFQSVSRLRRIFTYLSASAICIIPASWYARTYFTRLKNNTWNDVNLLEIRSPTELLFGSSSKGFESLFLQQKYLELGVLDFLHSTQFAMFSIIPRAFFDDKPKSIPATIAYDAGTVGSTSSFFMSEVFTDFYIATPLACTVFCFVYSKLDILRTKGSVGFVCYLLLLSNSVQLYKNGWSSVVPFYALSFTLLFFLFLKIPQRRN